MQYVSCDVSTICVGLAASMGQFLLCAGEPGKRFALPHSRILMHQPSGQMQGQAADIAIQAEQIVYLKRMMAERIAFHTGQPLERIEADSDRDRWFTAEEGKDYGFIDRVIEHSSPQAASAEHRTGADGSVTMTDLQSEAGPGQSESNLAGSAAVASLGAVPARTCPAHRPSWPSAARAGGAHGPRRRARHQAHA